jgi:glycosyltransferase involved in cell wall biosynthesis
VVATAVGGTRELIDDPSLGRLVPPGDADALAAALRDALQVRWDEGVISSAIGARTWDSVGARTARLCDFRSGTDHTPVSQTAPERESWTAGTR